METRYFERAAEFRDWLAENHTTATEIGVVFHSRASGKPTMTWSEAVDEALLRLDRQCGAPARRDQPGAAVLAAQAEEQLERGQHPEGGGADRPGPHDAGRRGRFARREEARSAVYSYENRHLAALDPNREALFRAHAGAWEFFSKQPAGYRQTAIYLVMNAKREETRTRRLAKLIADSAAGRRLERFT